ncbi:MAG: helix-turn-helix domain-containing protein [Bacteroidia bacterium]|nr:helix-turn-helix domain-containing protein [Bacteroidia bacterium]
MNTIKIALLRAAPDLFVFKPETTLYKSLSIGQKRLGQILRNEKSATLEELQKISDFFKVPINDLINR